ncbi:hypothetical protein HPP92_013408 [Vanilla planifolia]|uniref:DUF7781 domain-containing protein n=1 Tax=Vanilla planifolia TaxID=51239 RepID=A0A835QXN1_VANPL|nr:hypothetical protein HPP92_013408 [Vanilla planifolia]
MDENISRQEKVQKFEEFVDCRLKPDLVKAIAQRQDLKRNIQNLEINGVTSLRTMINLGSEVYMQADVPDTSHIFVDIGMGFHAEFTWTEALEFISVKEARLAKQIEEHTHLIATIKAQIKLVNHKEPFLGKKNTSRKEIVGLRFGLNLEFFNFQGNDCEAKLVLKPLALDRRWKFMYEPIHGDIRLLSKRFQLQNTSIYRYRAQFSHQFNRVEMEVVYLFGWRWLFPNRNKSTINLFPGFDVRIAWRAEYILPQIQGAVGTGEPLLDMDFGRLRASLDRVETILTHAS